MLFKHLASLKTLEIRHIVELLELPPDGTTMVPLLLQSQQETMQEVFISLRGLHEEVEKGVQTSHEKRTFDR